MPDRLDTSRFKVFPGLPLAPMFDCAEGLEDVTVCAMATLRTLSIAGKSCQRYRIRSKGHIKEESWGNPHQSWVLLRRPLAVYIAARSRDRVQHSVSYIAPYRLMYRVVHDSSNVPLLSFGGVSEGYLRAQSEGGRSTSCSLASR